jgi:N-methylhydantoinase A
MIRALRAVSTERGRNIRDYVLYSFGGSGPVHAAHMAQQTGIGRVVIPPAAGVFSAVGLLAADVRQQFGRSLLQPLDPGHVESCNRLLADMEGEAHALFAGQGVTEGYEFTRSVELRYRGQQFELRVPLDERLTDEDVEPLTEAFHKAHEQTYGHRKAGQSVEVVNVRLDARMDIGGVDFRRLRLAPYEVSRPERPAYVRAERAYAPVRLLSRADLASGPVPGPCLVEEYDSTTVVPVGAVVGLDDVGSIVIDLGTLD